MKINVEKKIFSAPKKVYKIVNDNAIIKWNGLKNKDNDEDGSMPHEKKLEKFFFSCLDVWISSSLTWVSNLDIQFKPLK